MSHTLYVLLTRFPDRGSKVIGALTEEYYTHASLGLAEDPNTFYSFVYKGFIEEKITRYLKPGRAPFPCKLYELQVSDRVYRAVKRLIYHFQTVKPTLSYTNFGVVCSLLHVPYRRHRSYFCSQFVAYALGSTGAVRLKKQVPLYLPGDVSRLPGLKLRFRGNMYQMAQMFRLPVPQLNAA